MSAKARNTPWRKFSLFARSPKGLMLWVLLLLAVLAAPTEGTSRVVGAILAGVAAAAAVDILIASIEQARFVFPTSSLLTGLFVALLLSPTEPWYTTAAASILAVCSKHLLRTRRWTVFNPAAAGLLVVALLFASSESWWGSLPDLPGALLLVLLLAGALIVDKVNKWPQTLAFLATFYLLFTLASFFDSSPLVIEAFRVPYLNTALFFAAFMLSDPPTSPAHYREQVVYGVGVAVLSVAVQLAFHPQYFLLAGLLIGNAVFAWWRSRAARRPLRGAVAQPLGDAKASIR
jgi:Na+-translocating ferredoxin:NAD+ oxidoreductase RnfD subunit